jgi:hypothetical protein
MRRSVFIWRIGNARDEQMITVEGRFLVTVDTMCRSAIGAGGYRSTIVFALNGDGPSRRENVVMRMSIDRLEGKTAKYGCDGQVVPVRQMHDGRSHVRVVREGGEQMVCTRMNLELLTNEHTNDFDS